MFYNCDSCDRGFSSQRALQQHLDSPAHAFDCDDCDRRFASLHALQQHLDSSIHAFKCDDCDRRFGSDEALQQHLNSPVHAFDCDDCDDCDRRFGSEEALQQHLNSSVHALDCNDCDRRFSSERALQQHLDSPIHNFGYNDCEKRFSSDNALQQHLDSPTHVSITISGYSGIPRPIVESVFAIACQLRHRKPSVADVLRRSKFALEDGIVTALLSAALRLLPMDNTVEGIALRTEQHRMKRVEAQLAEDYFCVELVRSGYIFLREHQQTGNAVTPDVLFQEPTPVCGHLCLWLEYKNTFGFRSNPYVAASTKKQLQRYATQLGPGAVVYKQGYETGHLSIDGVVSFRENEVLEFFKRKSKQTAARNLPLVLSAKLNKELNVVPYWISNCAFDSEVN